MIPLASDLDAWKQNKAGGNGFVLSSLGMGEQGTGMVESAPFKVTALPLELAVRGWDGPLGKQGKNQVELIDAKTDEVLQTIAAPLSDRPVWVALDNQKLRNKQVYIRIVDGNTAAGYSWIGFDGFRMGQSGPVRMDDFDHAEFWTVKRAKPVVVTHYGVPFLKGGISVFKENGESSVALGCKAKTLLLLGMTNSNDIGVPGWYYPKDYSLRFFVGDRLGEIRIEYADGQTGIYPLVLGDNLWWGKRFHEFPEPFLKDAGKGRRLASLLHLCGVSPTSEEPYVAAINPRNVAIKRLVFVDAKDKDGMPVVTALTIDPEEGNLPKKMLQSEGVFSTEALELIAKKASVPASRSSADRIEAVQNLLYTTTANLPKHLDVDIPDGYTGPMVRFGGDISAEILANVFYHNLHQMSQKVGDEGMYHTSTIGAASFGHYCGFGTYGLGAGTYSKQVWSRDMGRAIQELIALGKLDDAKRCADYSFDKANLWTTRNDDLVKIDGQKIPPHWCRNITDPRTTNNMGCFENDGHGLTMLFIYNLWRRLPDGERKQWLEDRWVDVKAAGDWIEWQFDHPQLSKAKNGILFADSECAFGYGNTTQGYSVYADVACMEALLGFSDMARSIGKTGVATQWQKRAHKMRAAILESYVINDGRHPPVWTLRHAGWAFQSSVLGPLILQVDRRGFLPDPDDKFHGITESSYLRLLGKWRGESPDHYDPYWHDETDRRFLSREGLRNPPFGSYGAAMGYGQGFVTQAALLLDRMDEAGEMLKWTARNIYYADYEPYIVPEGVEVHPTGKYWFRTGDLGNGVQQAEIMKVLRLVIGVDDTDSARLKVLPRMPKGWNRISIDEYPAWIQTGSGITQVNLEYVLERNESGMTFDLSADIPLTGGIAVRLGPFEKKSECSRITLNGKRLQARSEKSGDSFWVTAETDSIMKFYRVKVLSSFGN